MHTRTRLLFTLIASGMLCLILLFSRANAQTEPDTSDTGKSLPLNTRIPHARIYLSSLITQAEEVSTISTIDADEIRQSSMALLRQSENVHDADGETAFLEALQEVHNAIFEENEDISFSAFRSRAKETLIEIRDALPLLLKSTTIPLPLLPTTQANLQTELETLLTDLDDISTTLDLTLWLARLDMTTKELTSEVPLPPLNRLIGDAALLIEKLETYIATVEQAEMDMTSTEERLAALSEKIAEVQSYRDFETLIIDFEETLNTLQAASLTPPDSEE